jgi:hypothetical protein
VHRNDQIKLEIYTAVHIKLMNLVWKIKPEQKIFDFLKAGNKELLRLKHCESGTGNNIFIVRIHLV